MHLDADSLTPEATYRLLSGIVVPRPIAWITTLSASGVSNLAPFSCFTFVSNKPPMIGVNIGRKAGVRKDTGANILETGEFVVNIADMRHVNLIHESSAEHPPQVSEVELLGLATLACDTVRVPRLADVPIALECRLAQVVPFGQTGSEFFVGEITRYHFRDGLYVNGKIDTVALDPVCRIGGPNYAALGSVVTLREMPPTAKSVLRADSA